MAMAVQKIFPDAKVTIGPWIENGFYYDFDMEPLTDRDLKKIKKEMVSRFPRLVIYLCFNHIFSLKIMEALQAWEPFISLYSQGTEFIS